MKAEVEASRTLFLRDWANWIAAWPFYGFQVWYWGRPNLGNLGIYLPALTRSLEKNAIQSLGHKRLVWAHMKKSVKKKKCEQGKLCSTQPALLQLLATASSSLLQSCAMSLHLTFSFRPTATVVLWLQDLVFSSFPSLPNLSRAETFSFLAPSWQNHFQSQKNQSHFEKISD